MTLETFLKRVTYACLAMCLFSSLFLILLTVYYLSSVAANGAATREIGAWFFPRAIGGLLLLIASYVPGKLCNLIKR